jgi:hypothetical protein
MSKSDRRLLGKLELSAAAAAKVIGRSRQAVTVGIRKNKNYFGAPEILLLLEHARSRDMEELPAITSYVEREYFGDLDPAFQRDFALPRNAVRTQIRKAYSNATEIIVLFGGPFETGDGSEFLLILEEIMSSAAGRLELRVSTYYQREYLMKDPFYRANKITVGTFGNASYPLLLIGRNVQPRGFVFYSQVGVGEINRERAKYLWLDLHGVDTRDFFVNSTNEKPS